MICLFNKTGECVKEECFAYINQRRNIVNEGTDNEIKLQDTPEGCKVFSEPHLTMGFLGGLMGERR